ncbi:bsr6295 [Bradyrhizobium diazoefficiens USDA 110]|uniref:Bsr6295 protein n=1 Tax=Bradyrhizobium diazoefficiens (strain JCM 10833 / BCRC 13528 / IAM 13628 / NBRC 14792 / USDA 110) TaxID=224911 RepID=Q89GQ0_BRADU|nr:hypothetical protein Bdiaspc4_33195 [Bradyrhizobium diazoefficiens]BAC51560.1 bsr6295 [Bradyrhizobium diazoefficiens USDA 110]
MAKKASKCDLYQCMEPPGSLFDDDEWWENSNGAVVILASAGVSGPSAHPNGLTPRTGLAIRDRRLTLACAWAVSEAHYSFSIMPQHAAAPR